MLETKNLVKIYKPKKGVPVKALDSITLKFPESGMVFLLGKSGSGKSTLLNVLGGLDKYDNGEIIIKGVSSKQFKQKHFDSYRNTYVGFIFQEYNVLEDFTVGANIALAIELQNRKATDSQVNEILKEVDLEGYGARKPNELSGGQKQRVAIARALVKNPQIIMADEPTGALDSNTGKQVLETLKKLSRNKLVIVVSHDREFAETYADRIIELSDGIVISDVERCVGEQAAAEQENLIFEGNTVEVKSGYHITEEDRIAINEYIDSLKNGNLKLSFAENKGGFKKFLKTDETKIRTQDSSQFKLIKSKLPFKNAFKIGGSGLKHKKIRLCITILLSCIAFGLFGLADTFSSYNHINTCTNSLVDSDVKYVANAKSKLIGEGIDSYWRDYGYKLSHGDLDAIEENTGVKMHGVFIPFDTSLEFQNHVDASVKLSESDYEIFNPRFSGFSEINNSILEEMGFTVLAGALPDGSKNEIAISEYVFEIFKKAKYTDGAPLNPNAEELKFKYTEINSYDDILGKTIGLMDKKYTVTAVIDTNFNLERYIKLIEKTEHRSKAEELIDMVLFSEFDFSSQYSFAGIAMVGEGATQKLISETPKIAEITEGYLSFYSEKYGVDSNFLAKFDDMKDQKIIWLGEKKTSLGEKEIIATADAVHYWMEDEKAYNQDGTLNYSYIIKDTELSAHKNIFATDRFQEDKGYKVVGIIDNTKENNKIYSTVVCADSLYEQFTEGKECVYSFCVGSMPEDKNDIKNMVSYCYREDSKTRYQIQNSVTYELDALNTVLKEVSVIFLYIGLGFALFAALMLANFIGTSISYKKQEIGILRAIGSRSNDVFRIFFAESFIIAMINFVLSAIGVAAGAFLINYIVRTQVGILVTVLHFGIRQIILLLAVSIFVAFVASYIPVKKIASKRPIDAIRNR